MRYLFFLLCLFGLMACDPAPAEPAHAKTLREAVQRADYKRAREAIDSLRKVQQQLYQRADTTTGPSPD